MAQPMVKKIDKGESWNFESLCNELRKSLKFAYSMRRKNKDKAIPYDGPELTSFRLLAGGFNISENFSVGNLAYNNDEQNRDALDVILSAAVRLGIEQGLRIVGDCSVGDEKTRKAAINARNEIHASTMAMIEVALHTK